ncbi:phosphotransferase family protein [Leuconostoc sp. MS02]|uniref:Phosphotransferase family protein n=1 Tax=Leuconostoc aquikimchii TaxID=3236804 RepID=A0ABV3S2Q1_9LACO
MNNKLSLVLKIINIHPQKVVHFNDNFAEDTFGIQLSNFEWYFVKIFNSSKSYRRERIVTDSFEESGPVLYAGKLRENQYFMVRPLIAGNPLQKSEIDEKTSYELGYMLGKFHAISIPKNKIIEQSVDSIFYGWFENSQQFFSQAINDRIAQKFDTSFTKCKNDPLAIVHMDFRIGNVIKNINGLHLIDFGSVKFTDIFFDFAKIRNELRPLSLSNWTAFNRGYNQVIDIDLINSEVQEKIDLFQFIHGIGGLSFSSGNVEKNSQFIKQNKKTVLAFLDER